MQINQDHERWAKNRANGIKPKRSKKIWKELIIRQDGKCALTGVELRFESASGGGSQKGGKGCHPLYAAADHINPGHKNPNHKDHGFQILCYDINDLKAHLPLPLFNVLLKTKEWERFVGAWRAAAKNTPEDRQAFKKIIQNGY